ncbi:MAG TPA: NBR1-Ig-like domain-containing protein [Ignavibacteria bacterium]|nr:NBR1-Ig-like domain-containing protein [Ignavibacteria bacterium]
MKKIKLITALALSFLLISSMYSQSGGTNSRDLHDGAAYLSQSTPGVMDAGQSYGVSVSMKNTGHTTWKQGSYSLKLINVTEATSKIWSISSVDVNSTVSPGNEVVFNFTIIAPVEGSYNIQWQMANGNDFFGEPTINAPIRVTSNEIVIEKPNYIVNNSSFISQKVQSEMDAGQTYDATVVMKNSGSTTWTTGDYKLKISTTGADNTLNAWSVANVELSFDVTAGSEVTFSFKVTAPNKSGVYNLQSQLVKDGTFFGQPSTNVVVNVD